MPNITERGKDRHLKIIHRIRILVFVASEAAIITIVVIVIEIIALTHRLESNHLYTHISCNPVIYCYYKNCSTPNSNINEDKRERKREESIVVIIVIIVTITIKTTISNIMITMQKKKRERERKEIYHIMKVS